jgi:transforming growth factor-beta-induced protein
MSMSRRSALAAMLAGLTFVSSTPAQAAEKRDIIQTAVAAGQFKTLAAALEAGDLVGALQGTGPFTVFAPTDAAFAKLPPETLQNLLKPESKSTLQSILTYHVVSGSVDSTQVTKLSQATTLNGQRVDISAEKGTVRIDKATVTAVDIHCSNGVIHVIDSVLLPVDGNLVSVASKAGTFKTLIAAAKAAGLVDALSGKQPLTVFAPTDEAFAKLPEGTVANLLKPENVEQLKKILLYHVVEGRVYSDQALQLKEAPTLAGGMLKIGADKQGAKVNSARLTALDIEAANGVIHVVDSVLLPPSDKVLSQAEATDRIRAAVKHGSHLYNSGHVSECARLYMKTATELLESSSSLPQHATKHLHSAVASASRTHCMESRSWTMRHGLDAAYRVMMAELQ